MFFFQGCKYYSDLTVSVLTATTSGYCHIIQGLLGGDPSELLGLQSYIAVSVLTVTKLYSKYCSFRIVRTTVISLYLSW